MFSKTILLTLLSVFLLGGNCNKIKMGTATLCNKVWATENLDVNRYRNGDRIPEVKDPEKWDRLTTGAYCYYNNDSAKYAVMYGKLYNWYAVNDPRGLAPKGWHIPDKSEVEELLQCKSGGDLKSTNPDFWMPPNTGATNSSKFDARGGGSLAYGNYIGMRQTGAWWTATQYGTADSCWVYSLFSGNAQLLTSYHRRIVGHSVRCVKD